MSPPYKVMLVAAEASGDVLGAGLAQAIRRRLKGEAVRFVGVGGAAMSAEGIESPFEISQLSILGAFEGVKAYPRVLARVRDTAALARREKPDIAVLIDSWGFTLRVARALRRQDPGLPLVKYVAPQVWATRPGRARVLAGAVDHLLATQVMDAPYFERAGLATTFVGAAAFTRDLGQADPDRFRASIGAARETPILLMLPGSRPAEIERVLPPFEDAVHRLKTERPELRVIVPAASTVAELVRSRVAGWPDAAHVVTNDAEKFDAMAAATVALACSGSVTTELALAGCPMVVGYRIGSITYAIVKRLIRTPYITLFNIAAQAFVAPEFIQDQCTGEHLAQAVAERLDDPALRARQVAAQNVALEKMGRGGPDSADRAAEVVIRMMQRRPPA